MKNKRYHLYCLFAVLGVLVASFYPLWMGVRVARDMLADGTVLKENYPKYVIPYTPISLALLAGVLLMPAFVRLLKKYALPGGAALSTAAFFGFELLLERKVVVTSADAVTTLEDWQMFMCYVPAGGWGGTTEYKTQTPVEILMGDYSPAFKLHFYVISVVLILAVLNCLYGFAQMIRSGEKKRMTGLVLQSVSAALFLGLCVLACFTAFWRDGNIRVSPLSAALMILFFVVLGVTAGIFTGSFLVGRKRSLSVLLPSALSALMTLLMYIGEMILLHGHLYRYGSGFFFVPLPAVVLAPVDFCVILLSGAVTAVILYGLNKKAP